VHCQDDTLLSCANLASYKLYIFLKELLHVPMVLVPFSTMVLDLYMYHIICNVCMTRIYAYSIIDINMCTNLHVQKCK
jgi:hypothetical protein